jgi:uncharacterized repeat protein (TIGR01451 family)
VVTYEIELVNTGYPTSAPTVLHDPVPTGTELISGSLSSSSGDVWSEGGVRWTGAVAPGGAVTLTYRVTVAGQGAIRNTALVTDGEGVTTTLVAWVNPFRSYLPLLLRQGE